MPEINLTQIEADYLIAMEKVKCDETEWNYPSTGGAISIPLTSLDKRENFMFDISRGKIDLKRGKYQNRVMQVVILVRLDFNSSPHRNPDDEMIPCPHLHLYREGYGDKWAVPAPVDKFPNISDLWLTLEHFMDFCNISDPPNIRKDLFT